MGKGRVANVRMQLTPVALAIALGACDGNPAPGDAGPEVDAGSDAGRTDAGHTPGCQGPPGLYADDACEIVDIGVRPYRPRYALWSDGADKERYVYLPSGTRIDTSDPDDWVFPVGTRIYKTFAHEGVRLETRLLEKTSEGEGPGAWSMRTYAWNAAQDRVTDVTDAGEDVRTDVLGTEHDIPSGSECTDCHSGARDVVNSFSAIQLNHIAAGFSLETLSLEGWLTAPIALSDAEIPGSEIEAAALGYLHANCGNCHRADAAGECMAQSSRARQACSSGLHMWVDVGLDSVEQTATHQTGIGQPHTFFFEDTTPCRIVAGSPEESSVVFRVSSTDPFDRMPPLGTERVHAEGVTILEAWIAGMPPGTCP